MFALKKMALASLVLSSSTAFSGAMGPVCTPGNLTVPCDHSGWDVGIQALYLKPSYSIGDFIHRVQNNFTNNFNTSDVNTGDNANISWGWGFKLDGTYYFSSGNDFNLNWYHYNHSTTQNMTNGPIAADGSIVNNINDLLSGNSFFSDIASTLKTQWDAVNFELGQQVDFTRGKNIRFHGGFQYANIQMLNTNIPTSPGLAATVINNFFPQDLINTNNISKYSGFGPRVGADLFYSWDNGFSVYASGASALLVGTRDFNNTALGTSNANGVLQGAPLGTPYSQINSDSQTQIVPEIDIKAGAGYTFAVFQGNLVLDAGWMWANYFNALSSNFSNQIDFAVQGPYAGFKWIGNFA